MAMTRIKYGLGGVAVILASLMSTGVASPSTDAPKLIVAISVDQFSADLFNQYRADYAYGLKRLTQGVVFPQAFQSHAATETCPGHSTILTGSHPARTGIVANEWIDQSVERSDKQVYCSEDPSIAGTTHNDYQVSPQFLKVPTLGDRIKAVSAQSKIVSVAGKDRAAVMMGGHHTDSLWYFNGSQYVTFKDRVGVTPQSVVDVNRELERVLEFPSRAALPEMCSRYALPFTVGKQTVGTLPDVLPKSAKSYRTSVDFDRLTTNLAIGLLNELKLGQSNAVDVLTVGLSATDYVGHTYGTQGAEMCTQIANVDRNVGRLLDALDATHVPYVVVLTADHGGHDAAERQQNRAMPSDGRVDYTLRLSYINALLARQFKLEPPLLLGVADVGDLYLSQSVPKKSRDQVLSAAVRLYQSHPQVQAVYTRAQLAQVKRSAMPVDEWSLEERLAASFESKRSGDLLVVMKPMLVDLAAGDGYLATHGSPWNYDRRVPVLFYRPGTVGFEQALPVETVDILPTLAALIGLAIPPGEIDGRCLDLDVGAQSTCP
jgi:predicted AlkP superfamily pyrophosphatase or phosphodiesterase